MSDPLTAAELRARYGLPRQTLERWNKLGRIAPVSGKAHSRTNPQRWDPGEVEALMNEWVANVEERIERFRAAT